MPDGKSGMFGEEVGANTRDPQVIKIVSLYYLYYTAFPNRQGADFVRTSKDLIHWSPPTKVPTEALKAAALVRPSAHSSTFTRRQATTTCCAINITGRTESSRSIVRRIRSTSVRMTTKILSNPCRMPLRRLSNPRDRPISLYSCRV